MDATTGQVVQRAALTSRCFSPIHTTKPALVPLRPIEHTHSPSGVANPLTVSTFTPFGINNNRYFGAQGVGTFETEPISTSLGARYRLSLPNNTDLIVRDANNVTTSPTHPTYTSLWEVSSEILNLTPAWGATNQVGTMAHWLTQRVYPFYLQVDGGQQGIDKNGKYPHVLVNVNDSNAGWDNISTMGFGHASTISWLTADILGHEYTHAITQYNSYLGTKEYYNREPGALNEAVSDIFGTAFERYLFPDPNQTNPSNWNWTVGEDGQGVLPRRSMARPEDFGQPSVYGTTDPNWFPTATATSCPAINDWCGVHTNSGVMNKWFHTLCTGEFPAGTHAMNSISFDDAIKIVYRAVRCHTQSTSNYADMRDATSAAARELYGACSPQQRAVIEAWRLGGLPSANRCDPSCDFDAGLTTTTYVGCNQAITLNASCNSPNGWSCGGVNYSITGPNILYNSGGSSISSITPSVAGNYQYTVTLNKPGCYSPISSLMVGVHCSGATCDFSNGPRYVGTWAGLIVQIRQISGKNVLVTTLPTAPPDKYYPRGDNFWGNFTLDPGATGLQSCLNAGSTAWGGLSLPSGLTPPTGYYQGAEQDGAVFFAQNGTNPVNPCDVSPRHVGTWNGLNVEIRTFPNSFHALVTAIPGSSNDKYYVRGNNFWDNFTKDAGADQYRSCLNVGDTDWWGLTKPSNVSPPPGYQQGTSADGAIYFSTNGLRVGATEPTAESVSLVQVRPNPAQDEVVVTFFLKEAGDVPVRLLDLQGRVQQKQVYKSVAGRNEQVLNISSLATGIYALEVILEQQRIIQKLIKE
ncbi:M4 family metallopeptidase [Spirosoma sp. KNUC1025]|uniref:T9SS type A sorting domain-containing protein n=1 Tax=Spirosoma sp. KNUC1025 TaxID=2894082 RepID=UPI003870097C|nr:M4 family metallopeptidase [Spirosoma sp. KNUC1025]